MTRWNIRAIVIGAEPLGESDLGVRLFTPGQGRLFAVAKGASRSQKRFAGVFDFPALIQAGFLTARRGDRVLIEHADPLEQFPAFRQHPRRMARAALLIETARLVIPDRHPAPLSFALLERGLLRLHQEPDSDRFAVVYAFRLLSQAGYRPELFACVRCGSKVKEKTPDFSPADGGLYCSACGKARGPEEQNRSELIRLAPDTLLSLRAALAAGEDKLPRYQFTRGALAEARELLDHFCAHLFTGPLRSLDFLRRLEETMSSAPRGDENHSPACR